MLGLDDLVGAFFHWICTNQLYSSDIVKNTDIGYLSYLKLL